MKTSILCSIRLFTTSQTSKAPVLVLLALFCLCSVTTYAQASEEEAIKAVIKKETMGFYDRNAEAWQSAWLQDAKATRTFVSNNNYSSVTGWDKFGPEAVKWINDNSEPVPIVLVNDNFIIHTNGNMAWVEYDQTMTVPSINPAYKRISREYRAMVKKEEQWKIVSQITHDPETFDASPLSIEENLNANGYHFLSSKKIKEAIEVFKLNVQLFPQSANTYDSLAEAYAADGNKKLAIRNYEKSIELNPKNEHGKQALAKLRQPEGKPKDSLTKAAK